MTRSLRPERISSAVLVIDSLELRRAGVVSLLKPWADGHGHDDRRSRRWTFARAAGVGQAILQDDLARHWSARRRRSRAAGVDRVAPPRIRRRSVGTGFRPGRTKARCRRVRSGGARFRSYQHCTPGRDSGIHIHLEWRLVFPPSALIQALQVNEPRPMTSTKTFTLMATATVHKGRLTARQRDVLERLRQGASNKLIGRQLKLRKSTVKVHVRQIMRKLGASNRTQAALCAEHWDISKTDPDNSTAVNQSDANEGTAQKAVSHSGSREGIPQIPSPEPGNADGAPAGRTYRSAHVQRAASRSVRQSISSVACPVRTPATAGHTSS